jgi:hypothetical protein
MHRAARMTTPELAPDGLKKPAAWEYILRFLFGGAVTAATGAISAQTRAKSMFPANVHLALYWPPGWRVPRRSQTGSALPDDRRYEYAPATQRTHCFAQQGQSRPRSPVPTDQLASERAPARLDRTSTEIDSRNARSFSNDPRVRTLHPPGEFQETT